MPVTQQIDRDEVFVLCNPRLDENTVTYKTYREQDEFCATAQLVFPKGVGFLCWMKRDKLNCFTSSWTKLARVFLNKTL